MDDITLEYAEQYLLDRVDELLNHDVKAGTPFVFMSGMVILNAIKTLYDKPHLSEHFIGKEYLTVPLESLNTAMTTFNLTRSPFGPLRAIKLNLTHDDSKHLTWGPGRGVVTIAARPFLLDIKKSIVVNFEKLRTQDLKYKALFILNSQKFIGLND